MRRNNMLPVAFAFALIGCFLGAAVGYLLFSKAPLRFNAMSLIQLQAGPNEQSAGLNDYTSEILSRKVIEDAIRDLDFSNHDGFERAHADEIAGVILRSNDLAVERADRESKLFTISYSCSDAGLAADMVNSVVSSFSQSRQAKLASSGKVKILSKPSMGVFTGPFLYRYLAAGAIIGFLFGFFATAIFIQIFASPSNRMDGTHAAEQRDKHEVAEL